MSANIPFEIQEEILKRVLSTKSLIRLRSVSKPWKSLIDSSEFITHHSINTQRHHILFEYKSVLNKGDFADRYLSIVDGDSFSEHKFSSIVPPTLPFSVASVLDCSHGLLCLCGCNPLNNKRLILVWNPSIRKSVGIPMPYRPIVLGCGVCPKTNDIKIVTITRIDRCLSETAWKGEIFTLSIGAWRSVPTNLGLPHKPIDFSYNQVVVDGVIYWVSYGLGTYHVIISFNLTSEELLEVVVPDSLAHARHLSISKLDGSLVVFKCNEDPLVCDVWMMNKNGDSFSLFTKQFSVSFNSCIHTLFNQPIGFRKNGQLITKHIRMRNGRIQITLEFYDPGSKRRNGIGIDVNHNSIFWMATYTESLHLLNQSDSIIGSPILFVSNPNL
ncbi:putative F-box protein At1g47790 [Bidens hawaiensis]|uniref:putative F-box protein At1g47790 n=1 Tax=Bidens hawaiensis TaxID=980011 RepID=UPI00404A03DD